MQDLSVTLIQPELAWEQPADNRRQIEQTITGLEQTGDLVLLPEMFTTGFSMNALANAESPGDATEQWLLELARRYDCALSGSIAVNDDGSVYNRMLFATPVGISHYDKRHLFRMAGEHKRYRGGRERVVVAWRGWRILLQVCYDLRFPVFSRNRDDYDLALYVANWPAQRSQHWRQLLQARAIENQACVVGVNRIGRDANGLEYSGDSLAVAADGTLLRDMGNENGAAQVVLDGAALLAYRERFPCQLDADSFQLD
ncbi:MAG: amidohydrolase [Halieaceae bacterium]|nr:amidohydrolase [Halieaceae bacterium]MCP5204785.1 amidohydrolase [Pseudomonadales bacterium]